MKRVPMIHSSSISSSSGNWIFPSCIFPWQSRQIYRTDDSCSFREFSSRPRRNTWCISDPAFHLQTAHRPRSLARTAVCVFRRCEDSLLARVLFLRLSLVESALGNSPIISRMRIRRRCDFRQFQLTAQPCHEHERICRFARDERHPKRHQPSHSQLRLGTSQH